MKVRCPYCRTVFTPGKKPACPDCARTLLMPGFYGPTGKPASASTVARAWAQSRILTRPRFFLLSRPVMLIAAIAVLALAAIRLVHRSRHRVPGCQADRTLLATDNLAVLSIALHKLRLDCGRFPSTTEGLVSLIHNPGLAGWDGPYIFELKPDPWQRHFEYRGDGHTFVVFSAGPDGIPDSPDDITPPPRAGETFPGAVPARYAP